MCWTGGGPKGGTGAINPSPPLPAFFWIWLTGKRATDAVCDQAVVLAEVLQRLSELSERGTWIHGGDLRPGQALLPTPGGRGRCSPGVIHPNFPVLWDAHGIFKPDLVPQFWDR